MRHGNPPNFDAEPLMTLKKIAKALGFSYTRLMSKHLEDYYAKHGIRSPKRDRAEKLSDEEIQSIIEMRFGTPPKFYEKPRMTEKEISTALGLPISFIN